MIHLQGIFLWLACCCFCFSVSAQEDFYDPIPYPEPNATAINLELAKAAGVSTVHMAQIIDEKNPEPSVLGKYDLDRRGNLIRKLEINGFEKRPTWNVFRYAYDDLGRLVTVTDSSQLFGFQSSSSSIEKLDASSSQIKVERQQYHFSGTNTSPDSLSSLTSRSGYGNILTTTEFKYDNSGYLMWEYKYPGHIPAAASKKTISDDIRKYVFKDGQLVSLTAGLPRRKDNIVRPLVYKLAYDNGGRLTRLWNPSGRILEITYRYDSKGRVIERTVGLENTVRYEYNIDGQLIKEQTCLANTKREISSIHYIWNDNGLLGRVEHYEKGEKTYSQGYRYKYFEK